MTVEHPPEEALSKTYDPVQVEGRWYEHWERAGYFRAADRSDRPPYCIVIPPPNVTGSLHLGHALTVSVEDLLIRWKRMSGFNTLWMPGTDHAGIATQLVVERELKASEGKTRQDLGREEFLKRIWAWKAKSGGRITQQLRTLGCSVDWERERFTMDEGLSRSVREVFVRLYEEGLLYRAKKLINWCPRCRTALSDLEVEHDDVKGSLWHISYPVVGKDASLVVATTRPETMLGDTAVAVHPDDPRYRAFIGQKVLLPLVNREIPIIADATLVDMEFGSGAVKVTPAHDFNDYETGLRHSLEMISVLDEAGRINAQGGPYQGLDRFEARKKIVADLEASGRLIKVEDHALKIGKCQRCSTVVEPMLSFQWFLKVKGMADEAIGAVERGETRFVPEMWTNTFFGWMRNIHDWCVSRQLWWGHQIPAWYCQGCQEVMVAREAPTTCRKCSSTELVQDSDVLDTWFSSGLWPFSTLGWPDQTPALETFYPNSVMETGHDIIFFWVARMMMFGLHFLKKAPFHTVYLHAMVRDENGEKMSKVKGNVVDPLDVILGQSADKLSPALKKQFPTGMPAYGSDALRFTLISLTAQGRDIKLSLKRVEGYKAFANKLWNASRFALMNLGDFVPGTPLLSPSERSLADRWILARLNRAIGDVITALETYRFNEAASAIYQFTWHELCDWYIELSKSALYGSDAASKRSAQATLVHCLDQALRLLHPIMPFITEEIWQKLPLGADRPASLMIAEYPRAAASLGDVAAEQMMEKVIAAIDGIRSIRGESLISPAKKVVAEIHAPDGSVRIALEQNRSYLESLAGLSELRVSPGGAQVAQSATFVGAGMEIFVPLAGLIDLGEEAKRLQKEMAKVDEDLTKMRGKLANPSFVQRAPPEVIEKDRARIAELEEKRAKLTVHLQRIRGPIAPTEGEQAAMSKPDEPTGDLATAKLTIRSAEAVKGSPVDISSELAASVPDLHIPEQDETVKQSLDLLRKGTLESKGTSQDHQDLGVMYLQMGLVDDAVREFKRSDDPAEKKPRAKGKQGKTASKSKARSAVASTSHRKPARAQAKRVPTKKVPGKKVPGKKVPGKKRPAKKSAAKKAPAKNGLAKKRAAPSRKPAKKATAKGHRAPKRSRR